MKPFITSQPDTGRTRLGSAFDPVLSGVARGLERLFPPVQNVRPPRDGADGASAPQRTGTAGGQDGRAPRGAWAPEPERAAEAPLRMLRGLGGLDIRI